MITLKHTEAKAAEEAERRQAAEIHAKRETERRQELEDELERLRAQLANRKDGTT